MAHVISTTDATFEQDVIERSRDVAVVVDFWATWCQPCLMLGPILEKLAEEFAGRMVLVKAETEHNQAAAGQFNVSSIPAVFGLVGGEVFDFFAGVAPEPVLREWVERLVLEADMQRAGKLEASDPAAAEKLYRELSEKMPREAKLSIGLARALAAQGRAEDARAIIGQLEARGFLEPEAQKVKSQLDLAAGPSESVAKLEEQAKARPDDLALQVKFAAALASAGRHEEALEKAVAVIQRQRSGPGEEARLLMLDIFRVLPEGSELVGTYRRKLASVLY